MGALAPQPIVLDVGGVGDDAVTVDALARLQLVARRSGRELRIRNASVALLDLIEFMGLQGVLQVEATTRAAAVDRTAERPDRYPGKM